MRTAQLSLLTLALVAAISGCSDRSAERAAAASAKAADEAKARAEADARREQARLVALWTYTTSPAGRGQQVTAAIRSVEDLDTDGKGVRPVTLVFRDHPAWGKSSYLLLQAGDFNCGAKCTVNVVADAAPAKAMAARRPDTDEAIAMFINDALAMYRVTLQAKRIRIEFPVKAGGTRIASFDVGGLDRSKMPGTWTAASPAG